MPARSMSAPTRDRRPLPARDVNANYFVVSWQNDSLHEAAGELANQLGYKSVYLVAANYQAGKDALEGFQRYYKGKVVGESFTRLDQTDFAAEFAADPQCRARKRYSSSSPADWGSRSCGNTNRPVSRTRSRWWWRRHRSMRSTLAAVGDAALGVNVTSHWNSDFDNPANKAFMAAWDKAYHRPATYYSSQGYDTALAIGAALKGVAGKLDDIGAFRKAMLKADFQSTRGAFRFGPNQHPVQDWWALRTEKDDDGKLVLRTKGKIFSDHGDAYAKDCKL